MIKIIIFSIFSIVLNFIFKNRKIFIKKGQYNHQKFLNVPKPLTGGLFLVIPFFLIINDNNFFLSTIFLTIFIIGVLSDFDILSSPKKRFLIQLFFLIIFIFFERLEVLPTRINILDVFFENTYWSYFFTLFCLMTLINGSNFIDGLNGLLIGHLMIVYTCLFILNFHTTLGISEKDIIFIIFALALIYLMNLSNQLFLGDSGAYSLSFLTGYYLIKINNLVIDVSPYFIILLLIYPCYENLFSIIRKIIRDKSPIIADNGHLHHYLFIFVKRKFLLKDLPANNYSSLIINFFNIIVITLGLLNYNNSIYQLVLIIFFLTIYNSSYFLLRKYNLKNNIN